MADDAHTSHAPAQEHDRRAVERDVRTALETLDGSRESAISLVSSLDEGRITDLGGTGTGPTR